VVPKSVGVAAGRRRPPAQNCFARHWRGELSLPVSFWINGILAGIATLSVNVGINAGMDLPDDFNPASRWRRSY
jgi:hypothetical protein